MKNSKQGIGDVEVLINKKALDMSSAFSIYALELSRVRWGFGVTDLYEQYSRDHSEVNCDINVFPGKQT